MKFPKMLAKFGANLAKFWPKAEAHLNPREKEQAHSLLLAEAQA